MWTVEQRWGRQPPPGRWLRTGCPSDIIFDIEEFAIEVEPEVDEWIEGRTPHEFGAVAFRIDRLATMGPRLRTPHSRALGDGLYELRFDLDKVAWRITYWYAPQHRIVLLTVFRKQRMNEKTEIERARRALTTCKSSHLLEEDG